MIVYRRALLKICMTHQVFAYVARPSGANCIEVGLGFETRNGLQRAHVATHTFHEAHVEHYAEQITLSGIALKTGKLAPHFEDHARVFIYDENATALAKAMREVRAEAWSA